MKKKNKSIKKRKLKVNSKQNFRHDKVLHVPTLVISPEILDIVRDTTINAGQFETGGLFLGEKAIIDGVYTIFIKKATGPGQRAEFSEHHFIPDRDHYQEQMRASLYLNGLVYIGEWHKHPGQFDRPSMVDLQTMKEITNEDTTKDIVTAISTVARSI